MTIFYLSWFVFVNVWLDESPGVGGGEVNNFRLNVSSNYMVQYTHDMQRHQVFLNSFVERINLKEIF